MDVSFDYVKIIPSMEVIFDASGAVTPANAYVAENGTTFYVAEDGTTFYVQE